MRSRESTGLRHRFSVRVVIGLTLGLALLALPGLTGNSPAPVAAAAALPLPSGFTEQTVIGGLEQPSAVRFSPDGRVFVAEKSGVIKVFDSLADTTPDVFANLNTNVHNFWDRGLLGLALDPNFPASPYVYVLYTHDALIGATAPRWGTPGVLSDPCPTPPGATNDGCVVSGRLARLTAAGNTMTGPEQVLLEGWCQQYPSHSVGNLAFGADGALYVSGGDGAHFGISDYGQRGNPCGDPPGPTGANLTAPSGEGGALRSQDLRTSSDPAGYDGAILRLDPATGAAMPGNPLAFDPDPGARRIVSYGFRNPFRFAVKPGTNELWIGDVGWSAFEEIDIVQPTQVENFGWPCYEGNARQSGYDAADLTLCESLYTTPNGVKQPFFSYAHNAPAFSGDACAFGAGSALAGIAFYQGGSYPARYNGAVFFADYSRDCISVLIGGSPTAPEAFAVNAANPVDLQVGPGGDLFYVDLNGGTVRRISYAEAPPPPPPTGGTSYLSDIAWVSSANGWGPIERDRSNGELGPTDGAPLRLNGTTFAKGLGTHAESEVVVSLGGSCSAFRATVGVDDEVGSQGSVRFQVYGDGVKLWESAVLTGATASALVDVNVSGRSSLRLVVDGNGQEDYDHADWADARIVCSTGDTTAPTVTGVSPPAGATGVASSARPSATFSEPLAPGSVSTSTFTLRKQGASADVAGTVAYDGAARSVTLTPAAALEAGASYTARAVSGASGLKDVAGNPLVADRTWSFTVAAGSNTAPTPTIDSPAVGTKWAVGDVISFAGSAADAQDGTLAASRLSWALILQHCATAGCHSHPIQTFNGVAGGSFTSPDHEYPSHLELRLTATDSGGLTGVATILLDPKTVDLGFATTPTGLNVVVGSSGALTPFSRTAIIGSQNSVSAPSPQTSGGQQFGFSSWSDGGAQSHTITAPATNTTYTATFTAAGGTTTRYVSDLTWVSSANDWGPVERDRSNGEALGGDGAPLTLNGVVFAKGLGMHAAANLVVALDGACSRFQATVGVDDEVGSQGSVRFQVLGDNVLLWESAVLTGASAAVPVDVNVSGRSSLKLVVTNGGNNEDFDHADWAGARIVCGGSPDTTPPTVASVAPTAGAVGVAQSVKPAATFSESMTSASVTSTTFTLRKAGASSDVAASVAYDGATRVATLTPAAPLDAGASYTARVAGGAAGVKDSAGNVLATDFTWSFTVASGPIRAFPASVVVESGTAVGGNAASLVADDNNYYLVNSTTTGTRTTSWYGSIAGIPNSLTSLTVTYRGSNTATCTQTVDIWRWTTSLWVTLATRSTGTAEFTHAGLAPTGTRADYVSGTSGNGELRVRVRCTRFASFTARGEQLFIDYTP